jgi:hypothetical protein
MKGFSIYVYFLAFFMQRPIFLQAAFDLQDAQFLNDAFLVDFFGRPTCFP